MKHFNRTVTVLVFIFLYVPMIVLAVASFNEGLDIATFKGFTFRQYANLFRDETLLTLLRNSLIIAILSSLIATFFGTMAAVGIHSMKGRMRKAVMTLTNIPMTNPDIVTGVALALLFAFTGMMLKINSILGFWTLLIAHITFNLPYVILNVMPKLQQMDPDLEEAALDLGCTPLQMANLAAIIANRGYYYIPHIVKKIEGQDSLDRRFYERHYTMVEPKYFEPIVEGMWRGVHVDGTSRMARLDGWNVCGKTGTAQNPHGRDHSTFLSFAPKDNPKIAISVYVENGGFGATTALPIASLLEEYYLTDTVKRPQLVEYIKNMKIYYPAYDR